MRPASVDDPASLDRALKGVAAVINCAGPFARTAAPVIEAALRARIPYLDVAAEIEANFDTFANFATQARDAEIVWCRRWRLYGGLSDLLATAAMGDWTDADEISIAYGLDSWQPTPGRWRQARRRESAAAAGGLYSPTAASRSATTMRRAAHGRSRRRSARKGDRRVHDGGHAHEFHATSEPRRYDLT